MNTILTHEFPISKGVCQGDPFSRFLFIIAMEVMNITMKTVCSKSIFSGIKLPNNRPLISHVLYADIVIFVGEGTQEIIKNIYRVLRCFQVSSGLKVNFCKSKIARICFDDSETRMWAIDIGYLVDSLPFMHFGVIAGTGMVRKKHWQLIIDKF